MRTTFVLIQKYDDAKQVVDRLIDKNIDKEDINVIAQKDAVEGNWDVNQRTVDTEVTKDFGPKKVGGLDGMLGRRQPVRTNIGDVYAAGTLADVIVKTAIAPGEDHGLKNSLADLGVKEQAAERLADGVRAGEMLVFVRSSDEEDAEVSEILGTGSGHHSLTTVEPGKPGQSSMTS